MSKRTFLIVGAAVLLFFVGAGCWNRVEIEDKAIVAGVGIDSDKENKELVKLTVQIVNPAALKASAAEGGKEGGGKEAVWLVTAAGSCVFDAVRNFTFQSPRKLFWAHSKVIVIGEEVAKKGVEKIIDFFMRDHEPYFRTWVLVARGKASEIMEAKIGLEKIPAYGISDLVSVTTATSQATAVNLKEFTGMILSKTTSPFTTGIEVFEKEGEKRLRLTDTAVFKNFRLKGWLNKEETRGLLWILGKVKSGIIDLKWSAKDGKHVSIEIIRASSRVTPEIKDGDITITVDISEEGNIGEDEMLFADFITPAGIKSLEKKKTEVIKREIKAAIKKAQEFNTDIFGFGEAVYRKFPMEWKKIEEEWEKIFPTLKVTIKVTAKIRRTGLISEPIKPE